MAPPQLYMMKSDPHKLLGIHVLKQTNLDGDDVFRHVNTKKNQSGWVVCNPATKDMTKHEAFQLVRHLTILIDVHARTNLKMN